MDCYPNMFDKMAKALASSIPRRDAFKYVGAAVLGTMLTSVGVKEADAKGVKCQPDSCGACPPIAGCQGHNSSGDQCLCLQKVKAGACQGVQRAKCYQNQFCSGLTTCTKGKDCRPLGTNFKCVDGACCGILGVCIPQCATVPPCCSANGGASTGRTLAG